MKSTTNSREYIVPGEEFWDMDYCETPDFKKSDSTRFTFDTSILNNLPATQVKLVGGGDTTTQPPSPVFTVRNNSEWEAALSVIKSGGNGKKYTITVSGNVLVTGRTTATFGTVSNVEVTLKGNGDLFLSNQGRLLTVDSSQTVIIDSPTLTLQGLKSGDGGVDNNDSMVRVNAGGKLELKSGNIKNNTNTSYTPIGGGSGSNSNYGGGVYVAGSFTMSGGDIMGNTCHSFCDDVSGSSSTRVYSYSYGGGVYVAAGGSFTMTAGTISGNIARGFTPSRRGWAYAHSYGGGVLVAGSFTMTAGTISGNKCLAGGLNSKVNSTAGGGVVIRGTFSKTSGTIFGNDALNTLKNTAGIGHAALCMFNGAWYYRNATADSGVYLNSSSTSGWTKM